MSSFGGVLFRFHSDQYMAGSLPDKHVCIAGAGFQETGGLYPKLIMSRSLATSPARPETCANDLKDCQ